MTDNSSEIVSFQNDISLMGSSASTSTPGVVFHPHSVLMAEAEEAVGRSESTSICSSSYAAGTATTDEYNNNCYIRTPIRLMGEKMNSIGTTGGKVTTSNNTNTAGDSGGKETLLKSSPQSVMDKLMNSSVRGSSSSTDHVKVVMGSCGDTFSSNSSDGGGGDGGESLLHPPKNTKYSSSSLLLHPAYADNATDEYGTDESVAEEIVDIVDADEQVEKEEPNNLTKKIFSAAVSSIPLVDKFHDFITGNACWSPSSAAGGENGHGGGGGGIALLVPNAICADGDIMEMVDNVLPSSSSAKATTTTTTRRHKNNIVSEKKTKTKNRRNYDDDEEEDGSMDDEGYYDTTSNDEEETTTSYYTSDDSSRSYNRNHQHQKKNKPMAKKKKQGGGSSSTKKLSRPQDSPRRRRRGRSSTSKPGYNSDGESIRRVGSSGSRPRGMRPSSSSTSHTPSTADDDDDADFRSGSRGTTRRTEKKNRVITSSSATDRIDKSGRGDGRRYSSSSDSSTSSGPEVLDTGSSAAGGSSIMESVLSYDQATWMSMTQAPGMMDSRNEIDASPEFCQFKDKSFGPDRSSKKVDAVEGYFKVCI